MYEKIMILVGAAGLIVGIVLFLGARRSAKKSESVVAEITELRKSKYGIVPVVKYEKNNREYKAVHFHRPISPDKNYSVGDKVVVNVVSGTKNEFYFTDEEALYSSYGLQFVFGGVMCLIIGIILHIALA